MYPCILVVAGFFIAAKLVSGNKLLLFSIIFLITFTFKIVVIFGSFLPPKLAAGASVVLYFDLLRGVAQLDNPFLVQTLLNALPLTIFGPAVDVVRYTNAFMLSILPIVVYWYGVRFAPIKRVTYISIVVAFFPSFVWFSFFALRDPLIIFFFMVFILSIFSYFQFKKKPDLHISLLSLVSVVSLRPEIVVVLSIFFFLLLNYLMKTKASSVNDRSVYLMLILSIMAAIVAVLFGYFYIYPKALMNFGVHESLSFNDFFNVVTESRYLRQFKNEELGAGGGSAILSQEFYLDLVWYERWFFQILALISIPYPGRVETLAHAVSFIESLLVVYIVIKITPVIFKSRKVAFSGFSKILLLTYFSSTIVIGMLIVNFGNSLRMRLMLLVLVLLSCLLYPKRLKWP